MKGLVYLFAIQLKMFLRFLSSRAHGTSEQLSLVSLLKFSKHESVVKWNYFTSLPEVFHLI